MMKKRNPVTILAMIVLLGLLIAMVVQLFPLLQDIITSRGDEASIATYVDSLGWRGVVALMGLSALQVIIPIIPAPAVGILAGLSYGVYWGPVIFLGGVALGNLFVIVSVRQVGSLFTVRRKSSPDHKKLHLKERLDKIKRPELAALFLFMIPWVSSTGPYLFAQTRVRLGKYVIAVIVGNIPSTIMYVFLGDRISSGNYTTAIIIAAIVVVALLIILPFRKKIMDKIIHASSTAT